MNPFDDPDFGLDPKLTNGASNEAAKVNPFDDPEFGNAPSLVRSAGDTAIAAGRGILQGTKALTDLAGAGNPASKALDRGARGLGGLESSYRRNERAGRQYKIEQAEQSGSTMDEVGAYLGALGEAPLDTTVEALGTSVPTIAAAVASKGKSLAPMAIGAAQGAGIAKGSIYDAVERAYLDAGATREEAARRAAIAQAYGGENADQILAGAGLGAVAGSSGVESSIQRLIGREAAEASARGFIRGAGMGALREAPLEALQGGQEQFAGNLAQRREGFDTPLAQGVAGSAALEGAAGGLAGGGFGAVEGFANRHAPELSPPGGDYMATAGDNPRETLARPQFTAPPGGPALTGSPGRVPEQYRRQYLGPERSGLPALPELPAPPRGLPAPTKSQQMGINPADGPLSTAAAMAVDGGASDQMAAMAQAQAEAEAAAQQKPGEEPKQGELIDHNTGEVLVESDVRRQELNARMDFLKRQARTNGWDTRLTEARAEVEKGLADLAGDNWSRMKEDQRAAIIARTDIKGVMRRNLAKNPNWDILHPNVKAKLAKAMEPARQGAMGDQLESGQTVLTQSGRETTPFPQIKTETPKEAAATVKAADNWLMQNALDEALARDDEFNALQFQENFAKPSPADKDAAEFYLFGDQGPSVPDVPRAPENLGTPEAAPAVDVPSVPAVPAEDATEDATQNAGTFAPSTEFTIPEPATVATVATQGQENARPDENRTKTGQPDIAQITRKQIPDMTDDELGQAIAHYGPGHKRTAKLEKEQRKRGLELKREEASPGTPERRDLDQDLKQLTGEETPAPTARRSLFEDEEAERSDVADLPETPSDTPLQASNDAAPSESAAATEADTLSAAANEAATSPTNATPTPTEAQVEAGNYRKGHVTIGGLEISIENPAGTRRRPEWPPLKNHYGYIRGTIGRDKDHVDVFLTDSATDTRLPVFVVDQNTKSGKFDEHKVVMGAADEAEARQTYLGNYAPGWDGLGAITQMSWDQFKEWVKDPAKTRAPAAPTQEARPDEQPADAPPDSRGAETVRGRGRDPQQRTAPADPEGLAPAPSRDGGGPGENGDTGGSGLRQPGEDVADGQDVPRGRNARDRRPRAGGEGVPDAGTGPRTEGAAQSGSPGGADASPAEAAQDATAPVESPAATHVAAKDLHITNPLEIVGGSPVQRFTRNREALQLLHLLTEEGRQANPEEQRTLAGYIGWGSFGQDLFQGTWERPQYKDQGAWKERNDWLRATLGEAAWKSAQRSITNAHYTDPPTVMAMWDMVRRMGFEGGKVLEPALGTGNFFSMMPMDLKTRSQLTGIELDNTTGAIALQLFPRSNIKVMGYQDSKTPDGFYDLIIGNWPFENTPIADRRYNKFNPMLHDYFFLKTMDQVRPGGVVIGITSAGSMDKQNTIIRRELAKQAELIASIRLPSGAFEEYAGTKVVTDIVILRKRQERLAATPDVNWIESVEVPTPSGTPVRVNQFYAENPKYIIGTLDHDHGTTTFRAGMVVRRPNDMAAALKKAVSLVPQDVFQPRKSQDPATYYANRSGERHGALAVVDGKLMVAVGDQLTDANSKAKYELKDAKKTAAREKELKDLVALRKARTALADAERAGQDAAALRKNLKKTYQEFTKAHGPLRDSWGLSYMERIEDPFYAEVAALESDDGKPAAVMERSTTRSTKTIKNPGIRDAYVIARNRSVSPTLESIAEIAKRPIEEVRADLVGSGAVFEAPNGDVVPSDLYLAGNVRTKLREAQAALEAGNKAMERNIAELKKVVPEDIPYFNIETKLGATWVPPAVYEDYIAHMLALDTSKGVEVSFRGGRWKVRLEDGLNGRGEAKANYGTQLYPFSKLAQAALSNQVLRLKSKDSDGSEYYDPEKSEEVNGRIAKMREDFPAWLWSDAVRKVDMEREYNESRNAWATPSYDGSFMTMEGMALSVGRGVFDLRQHQKNAIWRAIVNRRSINAHEVGTGKTFTAGGIAIESRRYGIASKPLLLAHNANSATVAKEVRMMYPDARVLYVDNLQPATRAIRLRQIANDDWDLVVMPHSLIDNLALSEETLMAMAADDIRDLEAEFYEAAQEDGVDTSKVDLNDEETFKKIRSTTAKELAKARKRIIESIKKQGQRASKEGAVAFEDLGVDMLLVDEVHEFKKPPIVTRMQMKGLNTQISNRSIALQFLTRYVRQINNGGNVHTFTGTPITNTITEIYHQMRYVMETEMEQASVAQWDGWFGSFATEIQDVELTAAGDYEMVTRLAGFVNVPELRQMVGQYMDTVFAEDMPEMKPRATGSGKTMGPDLTEAERAELLNGRTEGAMDRPYKKVINATADMTPAQMREFEILQNYAKQWREASGKERREIMRLGDPRSPIVTEGLANKASFDVRLLDPSYAGMEGKTEDDPSSKASRVVNNVLEIYKSHPLANQVIFSDTGFSKSVTKTVTTDSGDKTSYKVKVFSPIHDIVERLVQGGIPRKQIEIVTGDTSKERRREIAEAMNDGTIRVVIGSTDTLGVGVNMQRNLRAMHHLDAPYMPGELEQRNGRGQRQGNQWNTVLEYRYMTDRLDGRRWQILAVKQRFINAFMKSTGATRIIEGEAAADEQSDILESFSEAAGDPRILQRTKFQKKLESLHRKERLHAQGMADIARQVRAREINIKKIQETIAKVEKSGALEGLPKLLEQQRGENFRITIAGQEYDNRADAAEAIKAWVNENMRVGSAEIPVGDYGGHPISFRWPSLSDSQEIIIRPFGQEITGHSILSLENRMRNFANAIEADRNILKRNQETADNLRKAQNQPFGQAADLERVAKQLKDLERDLAVNPVPPPAWLRQGAPIDSEVYRGKQSFVVVGHRYSPEGWFVIAEDEKGTTLIPYMEATDGAGMPLYDEREFVAPSIVVKSAKPEGDPPSRIAEDRPDYAPYEQDLFGVPIETRAPRNRGRQGVQPAAAVSGDTAAPAGDYHVKTIVGTRTKRNLAASRINSFRDLAKATQYLYRSAVERLDAIVTDENGVPLAVVGDFKGTIDGSAVHPYTILTEAVRVPGAAKIWFSHNHPSGFSRLSMSDRQINAKLEDILRGSGIEPMGLIAVGQDGYSATDGSSGAIPDPGRAFPVPVIEREQIPKNYAMPVINGTQAAKDVGDHYYGQAKEPGIILLNAQHEVVAWVPITDDMRNNLRYTGQLRAIYRAISEANASAAVLVHGGELDGLIPGTIITASENIAGALELAEIRVLDAYNVNRRKTQAELGKTIASGAVYSRGRRTGAEPITEQNLQSAIAARFPKLSGAVAKMLERGKTGQRGGVVVIDSNDPAKIALTYSRKTGSQYNQSAMKLFSAAGDVQGFYDPRSGLTFLVGPNLDAATAPGVLLHEMVHSDQRASIDKRAQAMIDNREKAKDPELRALLDRVAKRMSDAGETGNQSEAAAYIVEQVVKEGRSEGYSAADSKFLAWVERTFGKAVGDLVAGVSKMIRQWLLRHGLPITLTTGDLVDYAMAAVNKAGSVNQSVNQPVKMSRSQGAPDSESPDIRFSRAGDAARTAADMAENFAASVKNLTVEDVKQATKAKATDWLGVGLQWLGRRQLVDIYGDTLPMAQYERLADRLQSDQNDIGAKADELAKRWGDVQDHKALANLMHDATLAGIDADPQGEYDGTDYATADALHTRFEALSPEAQAIYREARDAYKEHHQKVLKAMKDRVKRSEISAPRKAELLERMDSEFYRTVPGVYFPLSRFGKYVVVAYDKSGKIASVQRAETMGEANHVRETLQQQFPAADGNRVSKVTLDKDFTPSRDSVGRGFISGLYEALDEMNLAPAQQAELEDTIGQLYLSSFPDMSWAKHGIHRKGTPGFSDDARRAFAHNMFHGGRHLAKLRYADRMAAELDRMQDYANLHKDDPDFDQPKAQRVIDEMVKRHDAAMNPKTSALSSALTSLGFVYFLGVSPAAAMVNLSQTALVGYPIMGAKWGYDKAASALLKASGETLKGKNDITGSLTPEEKRAYDLAVKDGTIDVTQAHDLAGIAQGEDSKVMWTMRPLMRMASFLFHEAEKFNRQVTFVAAYRLARDAGSGQLTAYQQAKEATYQSHFDYSTGNRARITQGNVAKVVLLFKQYAQNMVYTLARNAYQSVKGESPEVRKEARKALGGILGMHMLAAGVLGLPAVSAALWAASAAVSAFGDDDEPWDAEVALRNLLADTFGKRAAEVLARGVSRLTPADISGRVGLDSLIFPHTQEGLAGTRAAENMLSAALGPVASMLVVNPAKGLNDIAQGRWGQGLESIMPTVLTNALKAYRYASEGVVDKTGVVIRDEVSSAGIAAQALGFSPSEVRRSFEGRSAIYEEDQRLSGRRSELLRKVSIASIEQDQKAINEARAEIAEFNKKNPSRMIKANHIMQSVKARRRRIDEAEQGVYLPKNRKEALEAGRFADY